MRLSKYDAGDRNKVLTNAGLIMVHGGVLVFQTPIM